MSDNGRTTRIDGVRAAAAAVHVARRAAARQLLLRTRRAFHVIPPALLRRTRSTRFGYVRQSSARGGTHNGRTVHVNNPLAIQSQTQSWYRRTVAAAAAARRRRAI